MYLWAPFILQSFKKNLRFDSDLWGCTSFLGPKWPICPEQNFLAQINVITFIYLLALFIVENFKKFLQQIQNYHNAPFLDRKWSICLKKFFLQNYYYHSHLVFSPIHCAKISEKFFQRTQSYEDVQFLGPKWPISPN